MWFVNRSGALLKLSAMMIGSAILLAQPCAAEGLAPDIEKTISDSVFEVVVPKPEKDPLSYQKPLPMQLIPFHIRNDQYYSVGTAFSFEKNKLITAAHVMNLDTPSQTEGLFIRDKNGKVYEVEKIEKYSERRDFSIFTVKNLPTKNFLKINRKPSSNKSVYSVGNAYGQGIVIRNGQYTSNTPEEVSGEWKWIRFSAAASPGNSGGPLLDNSGQVIGIITQKSENENLNFALPISEALDAPNEARVFKMMQYKMDNMSATTIGTLDKKIPLPAKHLQLHNAITKINDDFAKQLYVKLMEENKSDTFPNGKGSDLLLHYSVNSIFPSVITQKDDKTWVTFSPEKVQTKDLGRNGFIKHGKMGYTNYMLIRTPDNISQKTLLSDPETLMDLILKGIEYSRTVGSEDIRITSLGKTAKNYIFTDDYSRKWKVSIWNIPYADMKFVCFYLPVPGGCIVMSRVAKTGYFSGHMIDLEALANFSNISYYGTLDEWNKLFELKKMLPEPLRKLSFNFRSNKSFKFDSPRFSFGYTADIMKITENSDMQIDLAYFKDQGKVIWDIANVVIGEDKNNRTAFAIERNIAPAKRMQDKHHVNWAKIQKKQWPYNGEPYFENERTQAHLSHLSSKTKETGNANIIYTLFFAKEGKVDDKAIRSNLSHIDRSLAVHETISTSETHAAPRKELAAAM